MSGWLELELQLTADVGAEELIKVVEGGDLTDSRELRLVEY